MSTNTADSDFLLLLSSHYVTGFANLLTLRCSASDCTLATGGCPVTRCKSQVVLYVRVGWARKAAPALVYLHLYVHALMTEVGTSIIHSGSVKPY